MRIGLSKKSVATRVAPFGVSAAECSGARLTAEPRSSVVCLTVSTGHLYSTTVAPNKPDNQLKHHKFGGDWTTLKLQVIQAYLRAYTTALKDKPSPGNPFRKAYIDAFAGTGYRSAAGDETQPASPQNVLFPDIVEPEPQRLLDGSARLALQTDPPFDRYVFIERRQDRCRQLEDLKAEFPHLADRIDVQQGEANEKIQKLCRKGWDSHRAVLFLDPYGMNVEWKTIAAVAATKAIDMWLLFPLGIGVNRLLTRSGDIPPPWKDRITLLLGDDDWYNEFYRIAPTRTLFGQEERIEKAKMDVIGRRFNDRLRQVFAGVAAEPGVLRNSSNSPLYLLCFAVGNENGKKIALRIAEHLLKELR